MGRDKNWDKQGVVMHNDKCIECASLLKKRTTVDRLVLLSEGSKDQDTWQ